MSKDIIFKSAGLLLTAGIIALLIYQMHGIRENERDYYLYRDTANAYTNISQENNVHAQVPSDETGNSKDGSGNSGREYLNIDYALLREVNEDAIGWIYIEGTGVNYPVMQTGDNSFYLRRNMFGEESKTGAVFADCEVDCLNCDIIILYAHNMTGSYKEEMFSHLRNYEDMQYLNGNNDILTSFYGSGRVGARESMETIWKVFAAVHADLNSQAAELYKKTKFESQQQFETYINLLLSEAITATGERPEYGNRLLMLSTCIGDGSNDKRRVVFAYEKADA